VRFTETEIDFAMRLRAAGFAWGPEPGQYVFDINGVVRAGSPFQAGVFLIDSTNVFESMAGGQEEMFENFVWLPTWEECRAWLKERGVDDDTVMRSWKDGIAAGISDRQAMYQLILRTLEGSAARG